GSAYGNRGLARYSLGDESGSNKDFDKSLAMVPDNFDIFRQRANLMRCRGDFDGASRDFDQALAILRTMPNKEAQQAQILRDKAHI
ncbi:hypothetical protein ABTB68_19320, partial [Acinetobacter baumannii]